jgi:hypothetical protein
MLKKIGLSAAALLAVVALAKPPAAMAADRDDHGYGDRNDTRRNVRDYRDNDDRNYRDSRDYDARDYRVYGDYQQNYEHARQEWRARERRGHEDRDDRR